MIWLKYNCFVVDMKILLIVHGLVQGVGYRSFVKSMADRYGIKGSVRNLKDGSVEVLAEAKGKALGDFINSIKNFEDGVRVLHIERHYESDDDFPNGRKVPSEFIIERA